MENMEIYNRVKAVPKEAQKKIEAGRLKNMTDINPMWRIRTLTELFGPCGVGWYYEIAREWLEKADTGEVAAFVLINLYIKTDGEWSKPIVGVGGSTFVANESKGARMSDEAFKMAQTDALSVACKNLGIGAEVYWAAGETKYRQYTQTAPDKAQKEAQPAPAPMIGNGQAEEADEYRCAGCGVLAEAVTVKGRVYSPQMVWEAWKSNDTEGKPRCKMCRTAAGTDKPKGG